MKIEGNPCRPAKSGFPAFLLAASTLGACSVAPEGVLVHDPYEAQNRAVHDFNKGLDTAVLRPAGLVAAEVPIELRTPIVNFSDNVALPGMVLNGLLQGDIEGAGTNAVRFFINTVAGFLGMADPAAVIGIEEQETDFGETLAVWGFPEGAYVELPLLGPSTERDAFGRLVDMVIDPLDRFGTPAQVRYGTAARAGELVIERGQFGDTLDSMLYDSADSYAQARLAYLQNRRFELGQPGGDGAAGDGFVDPFADPFGDQ